MYKSFNESMARTRGPGCRLESLGYFSLFGDDKLRLFSSSYRPNQACRNDEAKDGPAIKEVVAIKKRVRPSLFGSVNRKALTQSLHRNQQRNCKEIRKIFGAKNTAYPSPFDTKNGRMPTDPIQETKPFDKDKVKDESGIRETIYPSQFNDEVWEPPTNFNDENRKLPRSFNDRGSEPPPNLEDSRSEHQRQLEESIMTKIFGPLFLLVWASFGVAMLFSLWIFCFFLTHLLYFLSWLLGDLAWLLNGLARLLEILWPAFYLMARYSFAIVAVGFLIYVKYLKYNRLI